MEIRNPVHTGDGRFDCEINHPKYGWIPFTASKDDEKKHGRDIYAAIEAGKAGAVAPTPPPPPETREQIVARKRDEVFDQLKNNPPTNLEERVNMLEIIIGIREPENQ